MSLGDPFYLPAEQSQQNKLAVKPHAQRRHERRENDLQGNADRQAQRAAEIGCLAILDNQSKAQKLRQNQQHAGGRQQRDRQLRMPGRPVRKQAWTRRKITRWRQRLDDDLRAAENQENRPEEGGSVSHHTHGHDRPMAEADAVAEKQTQMLQIALTPAPVALELVQNIGRRLLVAAREIVRQPHLQSGASHQRSFDKIVAEDFSA